MRLERGLFARTFRSEAAWIFTALALRFAFAAVLGERYYQADESGYGSLARSLAGYGVYGKDGAPMVGTLGAPAFFSVFFRLSESPLWVRMGQAAVSAATAWMGGRLARQITGRARAGIFALAVFSVYPFFVYYSGMLLSETLYLAATVAGLWGMVASLQDKGRDTWKAAAAGAAWSAACLTRTEGVPIAAVLWAAIALIVAAKRYAKDAWILAVLIWALPLFGWAARNKAISGVYTLDLHGGMTFLHGTMLYDIDQDDTSFSQQAFELTDLYRRGRELEEAARDRLYFNAAVQFMKENPKTTFRHWIQKAVAFWRFYPRTDKVYPDDDATRPDVGASRRVLVAVSLLFEPTLILAGFAGAWSYRRRWDTLFPLFWMVAATFGVHVIVVSQMRYRLPVMPVLIVFACAWLNGLIGPEEESGGV